MAPPAGKWRWSKAGFYGVASTPKFFVNYRMVQLNSLDDLRAAIEAELGR